MCASLCAFVSSRHEKYKKGSEKILSFSQTARGPLALLLLLLLVLCCCWRSDERGHVQAGDAVRKVGDGGGRARGVPSGAELAPCNSGPKTRSESPFDIDSA